MAPPLLQLSDIALTFGGTPLLEGAELSVGMGERVCLVGRNGSGKSTLLKIAAGLVEVDRGMRFLQPGATVRYLRQEPDFSGFATSLAFVESGLGPGDAGYQARYLLERLGLDGTEDPATLSGGEARRVALAQALAAAPDLLLLDEPTNHLDLPTIEWLESEIAGSRSAIVLVSHDRRFLERLSQATVWLDRGRTRRLAFGFSRFEEWRDQVLAEEERDQHKLDRKIVAEEHWVRFGVTARRKRNVRRMADLSALREQRRQQRRTVGQALMGAAEANASGALVIEAKAVHKTFGARPIVSAFSTRIMRGDRIGIVGPNGSGKTTLVRLLTGALHPDTGTIRLGANLQIATLDQTRESLDAEATLTEVLTGGRSDTVIVGGEAKHVVSYMRDFLFAPEQARTPVKALSGGERARLMLASALARPSNLLVLDEPTNDLDLETLDVLQEMLAGYSGTVILISHDRDFIDRVVTGVIAPDREGRWLEYAGGYTDMLTQRTADLPAREQASKAPAQSAKPQREGASKPSKRRLNFNEQHALQTLPAKMEALQQRIASLQVKLSDSGLYARDLAAFTALSSELVSAQNELSEAEQRWLELEILREELEQL